MLINLIDTLWNPIFSSYPLINILKSLDLFLRLFHFHLGFNHFIIDLLYLFRTNISTIRLLLLLLRRHGIFHYLELITLSFCLFEICSFYISVFFLELWKCLYYILNKISWNAIFFVICLLSHLTISIKMWGLDAISDWLDWRVLSLIKHCLILAVVNVSVFNLIFCTFYMVFQFHQERTEFYKIISYCTWFLIQII